MGYVVDDTKTKVVEVKDENGDLDHVEVHEQKVFEADNPRELHEWAAKQEDPGRYSIHGADTTVLP